ncbi:hypothetical protein FHW69_001746 [Luteibacter sp. Sphag1AF]|uniref:pirin family protein n=1 Tax=Luteibacter sp. Sphag1AF TaxID=2587031 RepID=UPI00160AEBD8|nr:pirin family protein [Luteibacter sp. Sphag1AF]MBB3227145.1 hypothetical protein [Luteibacter sp. Sphag1AF]
MSHTPISIEGRRRDLGDGFVVRRLLPHLQARHVGPFVFFDQMGPASFGEDTGMDVRPHPHIGLATVTWLFRGAIRHRDSLGSNVDIHPGDVNWMTAGRGIVHSERTPPDERHHGQDLHGIQVWVALPKAFEEVEPEFHHHGAADLPCVESAGARLTVIAGDAFGQTSPVKVFAPMFFVEARLDAGASITLPEQHAEWGAYVVEGHATLGDLDIPALGMGVQFGGTAPVLTARERSLVMLFGGAPLDGERHLWWNFVSSSKDRIEQAKADWSAQRMGTVPGDDSEYIPLPEY